MENVSLQRALPWEENIWYCFKIPWLITCIGSNTRFVWWGGHKKSGLDLNASLNVRTWHFLGLLRSLMLMTWQQNLFGQSTTIRTFATLQSALLTIIVAIACNTLNIFFKNKKKRRRNKDKSKRDGYWQKIWKCSICGSKIINTLNWPEDLSNLCMTTNRRTSTFRSSELSAVLRKNICREHTKRICRMA